MDSDRRSPDPASLGILALLAADREERGDLAIPTELLLTEAGLSAAQISPLIGKSPGAVRDKARRAKAAAEKKAKGPKK